MSTRISPARSAAFVLFLLVAPISLPAQAGSPPATLEERMGAFLRVVGEGARDSIAAYFPRRGDWLWVHRNLERPKNAPAAGAWRFRGDETPRAMSEGGPLCWSFDQLRGDVGPYEGALGSRAIITRKRWRRVGDTRFVPPGESARSPAYVEWRLEDGEWVVSGMGDEQIYQRPREPVRYEVTRDRRARPDNGVYAAGAEWHVNNEPIAYNGHYYVKYGLPRSLAAHEIERVGTLEGVAVHAEAGSEWFEVLYVAVGPGSYHPYQGSGSHRCR